MVDYNYREGKKRVKDILNNKLEIITQDRLPAEKNLTFDNGYYSWVSAIFVDIRDSTTLFSDGDKVKISKIIRCFTSEIIEILRDDDDNIMREIGIRGDCVYAIYTTPYPEEEYELADKTFYINTYIKMLNNLLVEKKYPTITVGIGMATAQELVVKAGRKGVDINNKVWIGDAVTSASNLASLGNTYGMGAIVHSLDSYNNFINLLVKDSPEAESWFKFHPYSKFGSCYSSDVIMLAFDSWINNGMKDYNLGLGKLTF